MIIGKDKVSKAVFRQMGQLSGHWPHAVKDREQKKREGMPADAAWQWIGDKWWPIIKSWHLAHPDEVAALERGLTPKAAKRAVKEKRARIRPNLRDDADWIYLNIDGPTPAEPPSEGAMSALTYYREHREEFYQLYFSRLLPSRSQVDGEGTHIDNDRSLQDLIERVSRACAKPVSNGPQGNVGEPGVPEATAGGSGPQLGSSG